MIRGILIGLLLIHTAISIFVFQRVGIMSVVPPFQELYTTQIFSDLVMSASVALLFIFVQLRKKGKSLIPFYVCAVGTLLSGSFALLTYLIYEKELFD